MTDHPDGRPRPSSSGASATTAAGRRGRTWRHRRAHGASAEDLETRPLDAGGLFRASSKRSGAGCPARDKDLNPWAVGCYTSMARVKQGHRRLENELFSAEKMVTTAWLQGLMPYPQDGLRARSCATWPSSSSTTSCPARRSRPARRAPCG